MHLIKKLIVTSLSVLYGLVPGAFAASSVLPEVDTEYPTCDISSSTWANDWGQYFEDPDALKIKLDTSTKADIEALLGCALKTGEVQFWMVPYYVIFALEFIIELAGLIVVLMIMVGAYYYIAGGLTDDKEKGKTIITYAIGGFVLTLSSWILVNILLLALTS